ncbi:unnamed protein product [Timema podura]|uniref:Uncharacterized protein n=1 Tax=Timema podura TaxID=61482 RepID=A0ABN7NRJ1_TIMPD|nr:unnamed protein product [Timema podura]
MTDEVNMTDSHHNDVPYGDNVIDNSNSTADVTEDCNELTNKQCVSVLPKSFSANANEDTTELNTKVGFEEQIARIRAETRIVKRK